MKAVVLSSGGVDSTTCLSIAVDKYGKENVSTVTIFYGQKHDKEIEAARKIASYYDVKHYEFDLSQIFKYSDSSLLTGSTQEIAHKSYAEQIEENKEGIVSTNVPFRNGLMLAAVTSLAASLYENEDVELYIGAHGDDAAGNVYADCSTEFLSKMSGAIFIGTYGKVHLISPFAGMHKAAVVAKGIQLKTPYELTWSCYEGGEKPCGTCGTCRDRAAAFAANGIADPALEG